MSLYDYQISLELTKDDPPFYALIMAAMRKADSDNITKLQTAFPETYKELYARYHAPGGRLPDEMQAETEQPATESKIPQGTIYGLASTRQVFINGSELDPVPSQNLRNHSPDGFAWGYGGSSPSQLALAIALHFSNPQTAMAKYQALKVKFIIPLHQDKDFELNVADVYRFLMS